jgi:hypothetical protein
VDVHSELADESVVEPEGYAHFKQTGAELKAEWVINRHWVLNSSVKFYAEGDIIIMDRDGEEVETYERERTTGMSLGFAYIF